jgi:hypothetical protein
MVKRKKIDQRTLEILAQYYTALGCKEVGISFVLSDDPSLFQQILCNNFKAIYPGQLSGISLSLLSFALFPLATAHAQHEFSLPKGSIRPPLTPHKSKPNPRELSLWRSMRRGYSSRKFCQTFNRVFSIVTRKQNFLTECFDSLEYQFPPYSVFAEN